jgi:hypothetical protein
MALTEKQEKWIIKNFKNTKNDEIMLKLGISHSALHRFAREQGLKKTKQFQKKCQLEASKKGRETNRRNNWPPKGYIIPKSEEYRFQPGVTPLQRLGSKKNKKRITDSALTRNQTIKAEKRRVMFGLMQKTKLKVVKSPRGKTAYRYTLKLRGYIVSRDCKTIFFNEYTNRNTTIEQRAYEKYRFNFKEA